MNTRQRMTRSSLGPQAASASEPQQSSLSIKAEPSASSSFNSTNNLIITPHSSNKSPIPRGLMARDGTPASSMARLNSELRINPLKLVPTPTTATKPATRSSNVTTRGGAVKRQFKPKLPVSCDPKKNDVPVKTDDVKATVNEPTTSPKRKSKDDEKGKNSMHKKNGTVDTRKQRDILQMESSVFTGSAGVLKPTRSSKPSSISFGPSSSVSGSKASTITKETVVNVIKSSRALGNREEYDSDNFVVSDNESDDGKEFGKKKYSAVKPIGYACLQNQAMKSRKLKKKIKVEKDGVAGTEFNESFIVKPASDVFMKFLSLQQVRYSNSMMLMQVSDEFLSTESIINPEANQEPSGDPEILDYCVGRLKMYQSGKVEIVKPNGSVYEISRAVNDNIHVPSSLPKVMFKSSCGTEKEYSMQSNAGVSDFRVKEQPKYHVVKMNLNYQEVTSDGDPPGNSPLKSDREPISGTLTEIAHVDPREDLIATPVITETNLNDATTAGDDGDDETASMDCDS